MSAAEACVRQVVRNHHWDEADLVAEGGRITQSTFQRRTVRVEFSDLRRLKGRASLYADCGSSCIAEAGVEVTRHRFTAGTRTCVVYVGLCEDCGTVLWAEELP